MGELGRDEMVAILEDLAVNGGDSAMVQAIKLLREIHAGEEPAAADGFAALDEVGRRRRGGRSPGGNGRGRNRRA